MPIFEFKCDKCEKCMDKLVSRAHMDDEFLCDCTEGGVLRRQETVSAASLRFRGNWFATTRQY